MQQSWNSVSIQFNPQIISESKRIIEGVATAPVYDRVNELITTEAIKKAIPGYMVLPVVTVQHQEFVVGLVKSLKFDDDQRLIVRVQLKETREVDKVWDLIKSGVLNAFSIAGVRHQTTCNIAGSPCVTSDISLNTITICGDDKCNQEAYFDIVKSIFGETMTDTELDLHKSVTPAAPTEEVPNAVMEKIDYGLLAKELAGPLYAEMVASGVIKKAEETNKEEKEDEKEDEYKKAFESLESRFSSLEKLVEKIADQPLEKSIGFAIQDGAIVQVPLADMNKFAKSTEEKQVLSPAEARRNAASKLIMR
jgi:hypothetical protein